MASDNNWLNIDSKRIKDKARAMSMTRYTSSENNENLLTIFPEEFIIAYKDSNDAVYTIRNILHNYSAERLTEKIITNPDVHDFLEIGLVFLFEKENKTYVLQFKVYSTSLNELFEVKEGVEWFLKMNF